MSPVDIETTQDGAGETARDRWVDAGIWTVGLTAAVASWAGWVGLAKMCGWTDSWTTPVGVTIYLAWLLPFAVDIYALVGFRVWLRIRWAGETTRVYARRSTFVAIGLGVGGNAGYHLMVSLGWPRAPWAVVVVVSALPPIMLGAVAHLSALTTRDLSTQRSTDTAAGAEITTDEAPETATPTPTETRPETTQGVPEETTAAAPSPTRSARRPQTTSRSNGRVDRPGLRIVSQTNDEDSLAKLRETYPDWQTVEVSLGQIKTALGISGQATAVRLKRALYGGQTPSETNRREAPADPDTKEDSRDADLVTVGA